MVTTGNGSMDSDGKAAGDAFAGGSGAGDGNPTPVGPAARRGLRRGGLVTVATVAALVAAMGLTVLGLGAADNAVASYDASSWLWSTARGELARVNGITGRVDTRTEVPQARSHPVQITQTDRLLVLRDLRTGQVSSLDLATLQITATTKTTAGLGVNVVLHEESAFVVDSVQGIVRQLDPRSLVPVGEPVRFPPGTTAGSFDGAGRLWVAVPGEGTVTAITPAVPTSPAGGAGAGANPERVRTITVADPSHDLRITTLDDGVAVLDRTTNVLTLARGDDDPRQLQLELGALGDLPPHTSGDLVLVTVPEQRRVHVIGADGERFRFEVPGDGTGIDPAVPWAGRFYCADGATGTVHAFDGEGRPVAPVTLPGANGPLELEIRENHLFVNAPNAATARVIDDKHVIREVDKFANDVLGGDPPPAPPPPPPPRKPTVSKPSAPRSVKASAGNGEARVSWQPAAANGSAITRYVVTGDGRSFDVGADQRSIEITGLTNGETYRFSVHAVNGKGAGPTRMSNPVVPTSEVPDAPESVTAQERPDGTVLVSWPAANGQGYKITRYAVTAVSAGSSAPAGESTRTEFVVPAGALEYGNQYAFTVIAINEKGGGSEASPVSNSVVPFTTPAAPTGLRAATVAGSRGTISVAWTPPADNGRPITGYLVQVGDNRTEVTGTQTTVGGLGDGQNVTVRVQAVNEAGAGTVGTTTARTVAPPRVTVTGSSADPTSVTVSFTVDAGGGQATCTLTPAGRPAVAGNCSSIRATGLTPSTAYNLTVTATNAAGSATATRSQTTASVFGVATCRNGQSGETATYCDRDVAGRNGNEIFSVTRQDNDRQVGWARPGTRLKAFCKARGEEVYAYIYNNDKRSTWWVRVEYEGRNYIPWAWLNLEGGDDINVLPTC
ncbi:fibronectin type III domain-containing protein [Solwaraspora sp. WMMD1047]|uniref:fibronectin type III domain-containing protein n=1 Tax=Solwaraspora sp. WMMD1047 TaxID=3016102 RepID=UPI0024170D8D|nr:fibronectin type III domain-containing protein [Solwaraspora sp. WMMD1047]MDG4831755.1 fibronectin type III domain-containing protein [Solwaraspora sp. WMMD1047]